MKILVAEDDSTMRHLMATILSRQGIVCTVVENGRSAVEEWERGDYDCICMDIQMPLMDGLKATEIIREKEAVRGGHTIIIAITAFADDGDRQRCLQSGMDAYFCKPIDLEELLALLASHSKGRQGSPS